MALIWRFAGLHLECAPHPLLTDKSITSAELASGLLVPLAARPAPLEYLEIVGALYLDTCFVISRHTGDWSDLVQRVLELHLKQPQRCVALIFSTGAVCFAVLMTSVRAEHAAKLSLSDASKWVAQNSASLHGAPPLMLACMHGPNCAYTTARSCLTHTVPVSLPADIAALCQAPLASLRQRSPEQAKLSVKFGRQFKRILETVILTSGQISTSIRR